MPNRKRAVLYGRVSAITATSATRPGAPKEARSVDDQLDELRRWAKRADREVVAELRDDGISASRYARGKTRPDWQVAMEHINARRCDELVVWEISRSSRDRAVWAALIAACIDNDVSIVVDGKVHDPSDPEDGFILDLGAALAVRESAMASKRIRRSVEARAIAGRPHGRLLDGYAIEHDPATGRPLRRVLDPVRAPIIREIVERLLAGESAYAIAGDLNKREIKTKTGKQWLGGNIVKRVQSPTLAGLVIHNGEILDGPAEWPAIVTPEEFHRLQALFADPARKSNHEGAGVKHLLTGIAVCGVCDAPVRMVSGYRPDGSRRVRYSCSKKYCIMRAADPTDLFVGSVVVAYLSREDVMAELADTAEDAEVKAASAEVAKLTADLAEARQMVQDGAISLADFAGFRATWEPKLAEAEMKARPKWLPGVVHEVAGPNAAERWDATPMSGRRAIVKALLTVRINRTARGNVKTPFDTGAIEILGKRSGLKIA